MNSSSTNNEDDGLDIDHSPFKELLQQARDGDSNAVGKLIEQYRSYLLLIANQGVSGDLRTKMGASDAVQDSMLLAAENFDQFRGGLEPEFKVWLRTILANDIRKANRRFATGKRDSNREVNIQEQSAIGRSLRDGELTPSSAAMEQEKSDALASVLKLLTPLQREVIQLRHFEQLSFVEIGDRIDKNEEATRKLWARTIESIKQRLDAGNEDFGITN